MHTQSRLLVSPQMAAGYAPELEAQMKDAHVRVERVASTVLMLCDLHHPQEEYGSHPKPILRAIL